jgi:hypothetical protein
LQPQTVTAQQRRYVLERNVAQQQYRRVVRRRGGSPSGVTGSSGAVGRSGFSREL